MTMKTCSHCETEKPTREFFNYVRSKDGKAAACKECTVAKQKERYEKNKAAILLKQRQYYNQKRSCIIARTKKYAESNKQRISTQRKAHYQRNREDVLLKVKKYAKQNKEKIKTYHRKYKKDPENRIAHNERCMRYYRSHKALVNERNRKRWKTDPKWKIGNLISSKIRLSLKTGKNGIGWETLVGYTVEELEKSLKTKIPKGYAWQDFIDGMLHIDHKIPIAAFNYISSEDTDFRRCWGLKNLQLLPAMENRTKGAKLYKPFQPSLTGM